MRTQDKTLLSTTPQPLPEKTVQSWKKGWEVAALLNRALEGDGKYASGSVWCDESSSRATRVYITRSRAKDCNSALLYISVWPLERVSLVFQPFLHTVNPFIWFTWGFKGLCRTEGPNRYLACLIEWTSEPEHVTIRQNFQSKTWTF